MDTAELDLVVERVDPEADGVVALVLASQAGTELPGWQPGAHLSLALPVGHRQYSLCSDPADLTHYRVAVLLSAASRGGSRHVHEHLTTGSVVRSRPPRNHFPLVDCDEYLFIAGGIGITPLLPMVRAVDAAQRRWRLVYGGRNLESMAFRESLAQYGDKVTLVPQDTHGLLDLDSLLHGTTAPGVYCCGPDSLLAGVEERATSWPSGRLHVERFTAELRDESGTGEPFEVMCARSERTVLVGRSQTMLEALLEAGVDVDSDCEEGICGTCELTVVSGEPDHRDEILTAEERSTLILPCVSRAHGGRIVVDA